MFVADYCSAVGNFRSGKPHASGTFTEIIMPAEHALPRSASARQWEMKHLDPRIRIFLAVFHKVYDSY